MIIGFGQGEIDAAKQIIEECYNAIKECDNIIDATESTRKEAIEKIQARYAEEERKYSAMDREQAPERYAYFWCYYHEMYPGKYMVEFKFHHINRRHAFSPDGWALLQTNWILTHGNVHGRKIFCEA